MKFFEKREEIGDFAREIPKSWLNVHKKFRKLIELHRILRKIDGFASKLQQID